MFGPFDLVLPPIVLLTSIVTLPFTLLTLPFTYSTSESSFSHRWFKHFWWWFGPASKPIFASRVRPLLAEAKGVVLDIGPGSGVWMSDFGQIARESPNRIQKIYGVEPNLQFHKQLLDNAKKNGLECVYEPIAARADQLEGRGIKKGSVDTIITVHVLCSVGPHASELVKDLYECLKPGGQWLVFEHVASRHAPVKMWQGLNDTIWSQLLDGCDLLRDTETALKEAGEWETISIGPDSSEGYFECLPHIVGKLIKKG